MFYARLLSTSLKTSLEWGHHTICNDSHQIPMKVQAPERTPFSRRSREDWTGLESWKGFLFSHELGRKHTELPSLPTKVAVEIHPMKCKAATMDSDQTESGARDPSCVSEREEERTLSRVCHCWRAFLLAKTSGTKVGNGYVQGRVWEGTRKQDGTRSP